MRAGSELSSVQKKSIAEAVAEIVRNGILSGKFLPGEKLKEQDLCNELQVSRTPLREAFRILQTQNLITYSPYMGVTVSDLTARYVEEMWYIKSLLEPESAAMAAKYMTKKSVDELSAIVDEIENHWLDSPEMFNSLDSKFHLTIAKQSGNDELAKMIANLYDSTALPRSRTVMNKRTIKHACTEHRQIIAAIAVHDEVSARACLLEHLTLSKQAILDTLTHP